jgi:hypothetical protein
VSIFLMGYFYSGCACASFGGRWRRAYGRVLLRPLWIQIPRARSCSVPYFILAFSSFTVEWSVHSYCPSSDALQAVTLAHHRHEPDIARGRPRRARVRAGGTGRQLPLRPTSLLGWLDLARGARELEGPGVYLFNAAPSTFNAATSTRGARAPGSAGGGAACMGAPFREGCCGPRPCAREAALRPFS